MSGTLPIHYDPARLEAIAVQLRRSTEALDHHLTHLSTRLCLLDVRWEGDAARVFRVRHRQLTDQIFDLKTLLGRTHTLLDAIAAQARTSNESLTKRW